MSEWQYMDLLDNIMKLGAVKDDRTGTGTKSLLGVNLSFDLRAGFPLITTKMVHFKSVLHELLWMVRGDTHVKALQDAGVRIWDEWATAEQCARFGRPEGELGPVYGHQWRNFGATRNADGTYARDGVDQLANVVHEIRHNPTSRRLIVTGWNPKEADEVALPPCHTLFQFYVHDGTLSCQLYQRSADVFLGLPFNIASYALLTMMVAQVTGLHASMLHISIGDAHIYRNHYDQVAIQLSRSPRPLPSVLISRHVTDLFQFRAEDIDLVNYDPHPVIKAEVSV